MGSYPISTQNRRLCVEASSGLLWQSRSQQEECSLRQQIGLNFKEETSKALDLEYSFVWC